MYRNLFWVLHDKVLILYFFLYVSRSFRGLPTRSVVIVLKLGNDNNGGIQNFNNNNDDDDDDDRKGFDDDTGIHGNGG